MYNSIFWTKVYITNFNIVDLVKFTELIKELYNGTFEVDIMPHNEQLPKN
jgi:hypothetical protein